MTSSASGDRLFLCSMKDLNFVLVLVLLSLVRNGIAADSYGSGAVESRRSRKERLLEDALSFSESRVVDAKAGGGEAALSKTEEMEKGDDDEKSEHVPRTATGGVINTIMVFLTIVSFIGNGMFLVYVFWLSK